MTPFRRRAAVVFVTLAGCLILPRAIVAETYHLHPQDRVSLRVLIWDFRQTSTVGLQDLSGEYGISPEGILQLPLVGEIKAVGMTQTELGNVIADLLQSRAGLDEAPALSVELVSSTPVYVLGQVETRGAVPFRPGLSPRQALALAGGIYRLAASDPVRAASFAGELQAAEENLGRLKAERAGLDAELAQLRSEAEREPNIPGIAPSPGAASDGIPSPLVPAPAPISAVTDPAPAPAAAAAPPPADTAQARLQAADRIGRQVRTESYAQLRAMLSEKAERLNRQMELRDQQIAETRKELEGVSSLNERGLAVNARVTSLSTALSDLEAKRLELETALLLLEEQRNQAERDSSTLVADSISDRLKRMVELEGQIAAAELTRDSIRAQAGLLSMGTSVAAEEADGAVTFLLTREGRTAPIAADAELLPGDTLDVIRAPAPPAPERTSP